MLEREYHAVMALSRAMTAEAAVRGIMPEEIELDRTEHVQIVRVLQRWRERLQARIDDMREDPRGS